MFDTYTPTHARTQYDALTERRDYPSHVCPGQHCTGRNALVWSHRHSDFPVHTLTPAQWDVALTYYLNGGKR